MPVDRVGDPREQRELLAEQRAFYRAVASEYEDHVLRWVGESARRELDGVLESFEPAGDVLELASGPGTWTRHLLRDARSVTCVDAAPEMIAIARSRLGAGKVRFVQADIFAWEPDRRYDVVFFGFWLSHVPPERFEEFWSLVADCLNPDGRVFFVDDGYRTQDELIEGESSIAIRRRLNDGTAYRIVKVPLTAAELERRLSVLGWSISVRPVNASGTLFWGAGARR